jgi:hypothetical protein
MSDSRWDHLPCACVPFGWREFARKYAVLLRTDGPSPRLAGEFAARIALWGVSQSAWLADLALAPGWRSVPVRAPIFIIGHQRSGTTLMHRLLAADRTHARALCFHEMLLPAVSFQRGLALAGALDARLGGYGTRVIDHWQEKRLGPMDRIHRLRFHEIEEDEFVLWAIFASAMCVNDAPASIARPEFDRLRFPERWSERRQREVFGWYRACLMKKLYREPGNSAVWIVAKNPAFSQRIPLLRAVFPDARFIHLWRDPTETIPSRLSLIRAIWRRRFGDDLDLAPDHVEAIVADSIRTYTRAERDLALVPAADKLAVHYEDFTRAVPETIHHVYDHFRLPLDDPALKAVLEKHAQARPVRTGQHAYSLAEFGLTKATIQARLEAGAG